MKNAQQQPTDPTDNWLRQQLDGYSPEAPANAWQRLAPHLPRPKRRRPLVFWMLGAIVGFVFLTGLKHTGTPLPRLNAPEKHLPLHPTGHLLANTAHENLEPTKNHRTAEKSTNQSAQSTGKIKQPVFSAANSAAPEHLQSQDSPFEMLGDTDILKVSNQANPLPDKYPLIPRSGKFVRMLIKRNHKSGK